MIRKLSGGGGGGGGGGIGKVGGIIKKKFTQLLRLLMFLTDISNKALVFIAVYIL